MSRLTIRYNNGNIGVKSLLRYYNYQDIKEILEKLAHYEDLEEQGRLITLPCKVGDTIYYIDKSYLGVFSIRKTKFSYFWLDYEFFVTKEEAEAKLAELRQVDE